MCGKPEPIERRVYSTQQMLKEHPPIWRHATKRTVYEFACPAGCVHGGTFEYSRWSAIELPDTSGPGDAARLLEVRPDIYDYAPTNGFADGMEWHVNFADPSLFFGYGLPLFAQDEMQALEHPALGSLREALIHEGRAAVTSEGRKPTPVLVTGVERRCMVATDSNAAEGRPHGLYGNAFARATPEAVLRATTRIDPPTVTNLIAMAAPSGGCGPYKVTQISSIITTAFTGFRAAVLESARHKGAACPVAIHTGHWGCGAFGGNRVLMALLQTLAAEMAGVQKLVYHCANSSGTSEPQEAMGLLRGNLSDGAPVKTADLLERMATIGFEWGTSNGT